MKWTVAIVAIVVGVTGLCRADDARRYFDDRGRCFARDGVSPEQKLESCTAVIQSAGQTSEVLVAAYNNRGWAYASKGDYTRAIADYGQALTSPCFAGDGVSPEQKLESCTAVIQSPGQTRQALVVAYANRGIHYFRKGEYDRAIADLDETIRLDPKYAHAYVYRGAAYNSKERYDRAIADLDQAIRLDPKNAAAYRGRGIAYNGKGSYDRAVADLEEANRLERKPFVASQEHQAQTAIAAATVPTAPAPMSDPKRVHTVPIRADHGAASPTPRPDPTNAPEYASQVPASAEHRVALVIGNSQYRSVAFLPNPRRDAKAVADALRRTGFQSVELKMDLDRDAMVKALRAFRNQADKADWALIYFAGHGIEIDRVNYLIPVDAKLLDDRDVKAETVSYEELLSAAGGARTLRLIVLDACRVNPFKDSMRRTMASRGSTDRGLAPPPEGEPGTMIVYSAKGGEVAADDVDGINSPFARAFASELKVPGLEVRRLFDNVRDDVVEATNKRQQPYTYGSLPGRRDFYFVAKR